MSKNLQTLRKENLLKSKSYGFISEEGAADYLWSLQKGKPLQLAMEELSEDGEEVVLVTPKADVHKHKYEHERDCGDVFVSLALTEFLFGWDIHRKLNKEIIPDRVFEFGDQLFYLENERGTKIKPRVKEKIEQYRRYYRETKNVFNVLFLVKDEEVLNSVGEVFTEMNAQSAYQIAVLSDFVSDPLEALITNRFKSYKLSNTLSNTDSNGLE